MTLLQELIQEDFGIKGNNKWFSSLEHSSLVYDAEKDIFFWNSQNIKGDALDYLLYVRGMNKNRAKELVKIRGKIVGNILEESQSENNPYEKLVDILWSLGKNNREYWYKRCINDSTIDRKRLGYYDGWYLIPLDIAGKFVNFQCRRDEPNKSIRYWYSKNVSPILYNSEILQLVDTIYITEGPTDAILLNQEGIPAVSHTGGSGYWNPLWYPLFSKIKNIYYIQDNDNAGLWGTKRISEGLGTNKVRIFKFDNDIKGYDSGNYFQDGGTSKEFKELVESKSVYSFQIPEIGELNEQRRANKKIRISNRKY